MEMDKELALLAKEQPDTPAHYILKHGKVWRAGVTESAGQKGDCYLHALAYAQQSGAEYCEGLGTYVTPMEHAWCVKDGVVHDPTWGTRGTDYFGCVIPVSKVIQVIELTGYSGVFTQPHYWQEVKAILLS